MDKKEVLLEITEIINRVSGKSLKEVPVDKPIIEEWGLDSLQIFIVFLEMEKMFNISIVQNEMFANSTLETLYALVKRI